MSKAEPENQNITQMLRDWSEGKADALDDLLASVYSELHRQAARYLRFERSDHTLQPTALINEAYLKLIDQRNVEWESRKHFFAIAAQSMRRILVDYARTQKREKRGGPNAFKVPLEEALLSVHEEKTIDLIALDEALSRLAKKDKQQARIVELKYFSGLSLEETADILHISRATVANDWNLAKVWLLRELTK